MAVITSSELKWYYSGGSANSDPAASLGGAKSSVEVSEALNGLFDDVTGAEAAAGDTEYRCVYVQNTSTNANGLMNARVFIKTQPPGDDSLQIGLDLAGKNAAADTVADESTAPDPAVTFSAPSDYAGGLSLGTLAQNDYYAIWVKRTVPASAAAYANDAFKLTLQGETA